MASESIKSVSEFLTSVADFRHRWQVSDSKELWFRGEDQDFKDTRLVPKLYRPRKGESIKPVTALLKIENELRDEFSHLGVQLCEPKLDPEYEYWDWYFLMQHHGAVTRLLDWADGALVALHFASKLRDRDEEDRFVYILAPDKLQDELKTLPEIEEIKKQWKGYVENHPFYKYTDREEDPAKRRRGPQRIEHALCPSIVGFSSYHQKGWGAAKPLYCLRN